MSDGPVQNPDTPEQLWRRLEDERDWWRQRAAKLEVEAEHLSLQLEDTKRESTCYREHAESALARAAEALRKAELEREEYRATANLLASRVLVLERESLDLERRFAASQAEPRAQMEANERAAAAEREACAKATDPEPDYAWHYEAREALQQAAAAIRARGGKS